MNRDLDHAADAGALGLVIVSAGCRISLDEMGLAKHMARDVWARNDGKLRKIIGHGLPR